MSDNKKERKSLQSPIGIATFEHLWEPFAFPAKPNRPAKEPAYSVMLVFDKDTVASPEMKALKRACFQAAADKFKLDFEEVKKRAALPAQSSKFIAMPWRKCEDTDYPDEYGAPFDLPGAQMINFKSNTAPGIVDKYAKPIMDRKQIYAGCFIRVSFGVWPYDTDGSKGVTMLLNNVQKAKDGPRLAGRPDAEDEFDSLDDGDGDDDSGDDDVI